MGTDLTHRPLKEKSECMLWNRRRRAPAGDRTSRVDYFPVAQFHQCGYKCLNESSLAGDQEYAWAMVSPSAQERQFLTLVGNVSV
jgi:hypothetical protein